MAPSKAEFESCPERQGRSHSRAMSQSEGRESRAAGIRCLRSAPSGSTAHQPALPGGERRRLREGSGSAATWQHRYGETGTTLPESPAYLSRTPWSRPALSAMYSAVNPNSLIRSHGAPDSPNLSGTPIISILTGVP